jgi:hypothetical protein
VLGLVLVTLVGGVLLAIVGYAWAASNHRYTASTLVAIQSDPTTLNGPDPGSADAQDRRLQLRQTVGGTGRVGSPPLMVISASTGAGAA